jgi:asparagine synthase (glutamine-hydrolysing)
VLRYMVFSWDSECVSQQQAAQTLEGRLQVADANWRSVMVTAGCRVFYIDERPRASRPCLLQERSGILLGTLFRRGGAGHYDFASVGPNMDPKESDLILRTRGQHLISAYWGSYVAILSDTPAKKAWVLRSPMSTLPCLTTEFEDVKLYFSHMTDAVSLRLLKFSVNWHFIARNLVKLAQPSETGLSEVSAINSGECVEIHRGRASRRSYWNALSVAHTENPVDHIEEAIEATRNCTRSCVHAWAAGHDSILLQLSGGLDSSIVLACLREAPSRPTITNVIRYSTEADSDEREFARLAAGRAGCNLIEVPRDPSFGAEAALLAKPTEKPQAYLQQLGQGNALISLARDMGLTAIYGGNGGDEVFFNSEARLSVADYVHDRGIDSGLIDAALTASRLQSLSVWRALREGLIQGCFTQKWDPVARARKHDPFVNWRRAETLQGIEHAHSPWFSRAQYVPPGKQLQIALLTLHGAAPGTPAFGEPGDPEQVQPLLSQPLVELGLRIPTYLLINDGWDRAIARRAFVRDVPEEILRRRWKGSQEFYTALVFRRNLEFARNLLLDGHLVAEGLLQRPALDSALSGGPSAVMQGMKKLSNHLGLEIWLRIWAAQGARVSTTGSAVAALGPHRLAQA